MASLPQAAKVESVIDWCAEFDGWTRFLRDQRFPLSVADDLRIHALIDRLRGSGVPITDAAAAARWIGPIICRNEDEQRRLPGLLLAWEAMRAETPPVATPQNASVATAARAMELDRKVQLRSWIVAGIIAVVLLVLAGAFFMWEHRRTSAPHATTAPAPAAVPALPPDTSTSAQRDAIALTTLAPFLVTLVLLRRRRQTAAALLRGLAPRDAPAEAMKLGITDFALFRYEALRGAMADLRRHRYVPAQWLDGRRSVAATVAAAGRVQLVAGIRPVVPEYLFLVDLAGAGDILGAVADLLSAALREGDIKYDRFDFQGDPRRLRKILNQGVATEAFDLEGLRATYPQHRLLVLSDAASFTDTEGQSVRAWVDQLRAWPEVSLLTPLPPTQWGPREQTLLRLGFDVAPATPAGVGDLAKRIRTVTPPQIGARGALASQRFDQRFAADPYTWLGEEMPTPSKVTAIVVELKQVMGPRALLYFEALAVFPLLHPKLTLAFGRLLCDAHGMQILDEYTLSRLSRVPWMRRGRLPDWLRLALVRDLQTRPAEANRVRDAWSVILAPPPTEGLTELPIEVVRAVSPELPQLVANLLRKRTVYREALLVAFLDRAELPELAVALPGYLARKRWILSLPNEWIIAVAGLAVGVFTLFFLRAISSAVNRVVFSVFTPEDGSILVFRVLPVIAWVSGILTLLVWYAREWRTGRPARWSEGLIRASGLVCFAACCAHAFLQGESGLRLGEALAFVVLSGVLLCWCWNTRGQGVLRWAPLLVLLTLNASGGFGGPFVSLDLLLVPAVVWLSLRYDWEEMRPLLLYVGGASMLALSLWEIVNVSSDVTDIAALIMLSRFISDADFRRRCLRATHIGWRGGLLLGVPLSVGLVLSGRPGIAIAWGPQPVLCLIFAFFGLSHRRFWRVAAVCAGVSAASMVCAANNWPINWVSWTGKPNLPLGVILNAYISLNWMYMLITLSVCFCADVLFNLIAKARRGRFYETQLLDLSNAILSVALGVLFIVSYLLGAVIRCQFASWTHMNLGELWIVPYGALTVTGAFAFILGKRAIPWMLTAFALQIVATAAIVLSRIGGVPMLKPFFSSTTLPFGFGSLIVAPGYEMLVSALSFGALIWIVAQRSSAAVNAFIAEQRDASRSGEGKPNAESRHLPLLDIGGWLWPAVALAIAVLTVAYRPEVITALQQGEAPPVSQAVPLVEHNSPTPTPQQEPPSATSGGGGFSGETNSQGSDFSGPVQAIPDRQKTDQRTPRLPSKKTPDKRQ